MSVIRLENVNVAYPVLEDHYKSIRRAALRLLSGGRMYQEDVQIKMVHALQDISLDFHEGDRVGLVGRNGAGKSTLLKTIGGFILPNSGTLEVSGRVTALFSVNGGMDMERSGIENVYFMGRMLGMPRAVMETHMEDIAEFSELGEFLDMPVRSYSDGMKVRLGFAIATCLQPEILVLDEAIGAGDAHFLQKAAERARKLYERARIIVMASHDHALLQKLCNKAVWIDRGKVVKTGASAEVIAAYAEAG